MTGVQTCALPILTGARVALPVWTEFMKTAHAELPREPFEPPPGIVTRTICTETGALATEDCPETLEEVFPQGAEPVRHCERHGPEEREPEPRTGIFGL